MCQIWKLDVVLPAVSVLVCDQSYLTHTHIQYTPRLKCLCHIHRPLERYLCLLKVTL